MKVLGILYTLALLDHAFAGFRVAAGRDGRIHNRAYYQAAILRGGALGLFWLGLSSVALFIAQSLFPDARALLLEAGAAAIWVYGAYATLVLLGFLPYFGGGIELRTLATVAVLGPFTMLRLPVIVGGALLGIFTAPGGATYAAGAFAMLIGLAAEPWLDRWRRARPLP